MKRYHSTEQDVIDGAERVLAQSEQSGGATTVTALATELGISRQVLYRAFPTQVEDFRTRAAELRHCAVPRRREPDDQAETIARLRRERDDLLAHVKIYEEYIRRLATENSRSTAQLEELAGVVLLPARPHEPAHQQPTPPSRPTAEDLPAREAQVIPIKRV